MLQMDEIQKRLLNEVADLHDVPTGAYNFRANGTSVGRKSTANIDIESKEDGSDLEITVKDDCDMHSIAKENKPCSRCPSEGNIGVFVIETLMSDVKFGIGEDGRKFIRMVKRV